MPTDHTTGAPRLGVLVSGRGSNLQSLIEATADGREDARIAIVISNVAGVFALQRAQAAGIPTAVIDHRGWQSRDDFDCALVEALRAHDVSLVCLAGFMWRLGKPVLQAFPDAVLNIHPSLLPAFPGLHPQRQALEHGVKVSGVTVHLVTEDLDAGPILVQRAVPVLDDDSEESLAARILAEEHAAYPAAVRMMLAGDWRIEGRRFVRGAGLQTPD
jgi:phosphoribosylglycinamide formyltransferase-1